MTSSWRLDWRGSSGSLWSRSRGHGGPDSLDLLNGSPHSPDSPTPSRTRHRGSLRKRFRSLTEGLAGFLTGDKKEKDQDKKDIIRPTNFRPFDHSRDMVATDVWPDHNLRGSAASLAAFSRDRDVSPSLPSQASSRQGRALPQTPPADNHSECDSTSGSRTHAGPVKAPPSPPPRRFSLWAMDVQYVHYQYSPAPPSPAPSTPACLKPSQTPPPPLSRSPPSPCFSRAQPSPRVRGSSTPPRSPHTPRRQASPRCVTPPGGVLNTPVGSPVMRGRSLSDSKVESRGKISSRAAWYRRKSQARRHAHAC